PGHPKQIPADIEVTLEGPDDLLLEAQDFVVVACTQGAPLPMNICLRRIIAVAGRSTLLHRLGGGAGGALELTERPFAPGETRMERTQQTLIAQRRRDRFVARQETVILGKL